MYDVVARIFGKSYDRTTKAGEAGGRCRIRERERERERER
jgi:hypothetical protein